MSSVVISGDTSGAITLAAPAIAGTNTLSLPAQTATIATLTTPSFATTIGVGGATAAASGAGITFPASQSASSDANTLDDYEEGTFTPFLGGSGGNPTGVTYVNQQGKYVKIGKQVTVLGTLSFTTYTGGSGSIQISGLPFTSANDGIGAWGSSMVEQVSLGVGKTFTSTAISSNSGSIIVVAGGSSVNYDNLTFTAVASSGTTKYLTYGITYFAN
jgi:hypothetical protein